MQTFDACQICLSLNDIKFAIKILHYALSEKYENLRKILFQYF